MGNEVPCCALAAEQIDNDLLEKAVRKDSLKHDMRLARHNKLVNRANLSHAVLPPSPPSNNSNPSSSINPFDLATKTGTSNKFEMFTGAGQQQSDRRLSSRRTSKQNKNQQRSSQISESSQVKGILKPSSYGVSNASGSPSTDGSLTLKLHKTEQVAAELHQQHAKREKSLQQSAEVQYAVNNRKQSQFAPQNCPGSETENSTPSTVEERAQKQRQMTDDSMSNSMHRMEDIFNSEEDLDEESPKGEAELSFSEISKQFNKNVRSGKEPRRANTMVLLKNSSSAVMRLIPSTKFDKKQVAVILADDQDDLLSGRPTVDSNNYFSGVIPDKIDRHRRSKTDYVRTSAYMFTSSKKLQEQKTNNLDVDVDAVNNKCNLSDHLYERKKRNQNRNRKGKITTITKAAGKK